MSPHVSEVETGAHSESQRLLGDATFNVAGRMTVAVVGMFIMPLMLRFLGAAQYGVWLSAMAVVSLCSTIDFGLGWAVTRASAAEPDTDSRRTFLRSVLVSFIAMGFLGTAILSAVGYLAKDYLLSIQVNRGTVLVVYFFAGVSFLGDWLVAYSQSLLYGLRRFDLWNSILIVVSVGRAIGVAILLIYFHANLERVALWHATCSVATAVLALAIGGWLSGIFVPHGSWFKVSSLVSHLSFGIPSQIAALAVTGIWQLGPILLGYTSSTAAVTALSVGQRIPTAVSGLGSSLSETVFPAAAEHHATEDLEKSRIVLRAGARWALLPVLPSCLFALALAPEILQVWIGDPDPAITFVFRIASIAIILEAMGYSALHLLWGRGRAAILATIYGTAVCIAAPVLYGVGARYGASGIALCVLAVTGTCMPIVVYVAAHEVGITLRSVFVVALTRNLLASVAGAAAAYALLHSMPGPLLLRLLSAAVLFSLIWAATLLVGAGNTEFRKLLRKIYPLRAAYCLAHELVDNITGGRGQIIRFYDRLWARTEDPFGYGQTEQHHARFQDMLATIHGLFGDRRPKTLEVGCAQGIFTEVLEPVCESLLAVDTSDSGIAQARRRKQWAATTSFGILDLLGSDMPPDRYELVVAMHVVEFARRSDNRKSRERLFQFLAPGGYLILDSQRHSSELEDAFFRRFFYRGKWLNQMFAEHPQLEVVKEVVGDLDIITVYRRR